MKTKKTQLGKLGVACAAYCLTLLVPYSANAAGAATDYCTVAPPNSYVVTSSDDAGAGTLRAAITAANADGTASRITFNVTLPVPTATPTITLASKLPSISGGATCINGEDGSGVRSVTIDANNIATTGLVLEGDASGSTIQGMILTNVLADSGDEGSGMGILAVVVDSVTIRNNEILINDVAGVFIVDSTKVLVDGNYVHDNGDSGIWVLGDALVQPASDNVITNNTIGDNGFDGIEIAQEAPRTHVEGNTISGSALNAIFVGFGSDDSKVLSNMMTGTGLSGFEVRESDGVLATDNTITGNGAHGVQVRHSDNVTLKRNTVTGNANNGIFLFAGTTGFVLEDNNIITGNGNNGINFQGAPNTRIGSSNNAVARNTISNNGGHGIRAYNSSDNPHVLNNDIQDNGGRGLLVDTQSLFSLFSQSYLQSDDWLPPAGSVGGLVQGNTISGSGSQGILIQGDMDDEVAGFCTNPLHPVFDLDTSSLVTRYLDDAVSVVTGPFGSLFLEPGIGGDLENDYCQLKFFGPADAHPMERDLLGDLTGNYLEALCDGGPCDGAARGISIIANSIYGNGALGIDLTTAPGIVDYGLASFNFGAGPITARGTVTATTVGDGVTANDNNMDADNCDSVLNPLQVESCPNDLQNYPVLLSVSSNPAQSFIEAKLKSSPNDVFRVEFYSNSEVDASGHGQGEVYLGYKTVSTDSSGEVTFTLNYNEKSSGTALAVDENGMTYITATATQKVCDQPGSPPGCKFASTSEFSKACAWDTDTESTTCP